MLVACVVRPSFAQTTVGTGSSVGAVTDPSGAVVIGAGITITHLGTGQVIRLTTNSSGTILYIPLTTLGSQNCYVTHHLLGRDGYPGRA
jgi:hypothetical protein